MPRVTPLLKQSHTPVKSLTTAAKVPEGGDVSRSANSPSLLPRQASPTCAATIGAQGLIAHPAPTSTAMIASLSYIITARH